MEFIKEIILDNNSGQVAGKAMHEALKDNKVVKLVPNWHITDLRAFYDQTISQIGEVIEIGEDFTKGGVQTGERWLEIRYDHDIPDLAAYRHSKNAQPLHTDESYIPDPADIMVFYCVNRAPKGGGTTFVNGPELVEYLERNHSSLLAELCTTKVRYEKGGQSRTEKIIDLSNPAKPAFNYNYYCIDKSESQENKSLNERFFKVLQEEVAHSYMAKKVYLAPGEGVAWWDHFVLHGRESFAAFKTNDRFIWKAGIKWKS